MNMRSYPNLHLDTNYCKGTVLLLPSWSWWYGSWIYN